MRAIVASRGGFQRAPSEAAPRRAIHEIVNETAASFLKADDNLSTGPARCGPTAESTGFQEREPLDLLAGVINCTSFN